MADFHGAKLAILVGPRIVTILRDDIPGIPWPGHWDLPGGGREPGESPEECVLRELVEELGVVLTTDDLHWRMLSPSPQGGSVWFFVSEKAGFDPKTVCFGDEGQAWKLAPLDWFLSAEKVISHQKSCLKTYLGARARGVITAPE